MAVEVLVETSIEHLNDDPRAYDILEDIVDATLSGSATLVDSPSEVNATGIVIDQAAFTCSRLVFRDQLSVGGNVKIMSGRTYDNGTRVDRAIRFESLVRVAAAIQFSWRPKPLPAS